jgi:hypothetical protein
MKRNKLLLLFMFATQFSLAQEEIENEIEQLAINSTEQTNEFIENLPIEKQSSYNINTVTAEELSALLILTNQEIEAFLLHRSLYGNFLSLLELQAIDKWSTVTIKKILPYLYFSSSPDKINVKQSISEGKHILLYRTGGKPNNYALNGTWLTKNKQLLTYKFKYKEQLHAGFTLEKDAGESNLLDHYGVFFHLKNKGIIKDLIIGDYNINIGQGLIHWQGYAFGRSSNLLGGYRQGKFIQPHTGIDENRFHRGVAIQLKRGKFELGGFASRLNIDANVITDSLTNLSTVSSLLLSGLHRNDAEKADKNRLTKISWGGKLKLHLPKGALNLNFIQTTFSIPIQKRALPYNQFAMAGNRWNNMSIDFAIPTKIGFMFSELGFDHQVDHAFNMGLIKSLDPKLDISIIYRNMSPKYRAFESNCISRNTEAGNETGLLFSFNFSFHPKHTLEGFADYYQNKWPGYTSDRPSMGNLFSIQYNWRPNKKTQFSTRFQIEKRTSNQGYENNHTSQIGETITHRWRTHISFIPLESLTIRCRNELVTVKEPYTQASIGQLSYFEFIFKPIAEPLSISLRYTFFSTDNYSSRVYDYERDLSSFYSIPAHFDQGNRSYLLIQYNYRKAVKIQAKMIGDQRKEKNNVFAFNQLPIRNKEWRLQIIWEMGS